ncbi:MAG TPA: hypothetical protein DCS93_42015 [Microscillaceae bacterium]|nr:hypothetical protein [Microscillaceae bacterium]
MAAIEPPTSDNTAELQHSVGGVLKGIVQARVSADAYIRDISAVYAQDDMLKYFPVPRTEIKHIALNLRFATKSVNAQSLNTRQQKEIDNRGGQLLIDMISQLFAFIAVDKGLASGYYVLHTAGNKYTNFTSDNTKASFITQLKNTLPGYLTSNGTNLEALDQVIDVFFQYQGASLWKAAALQMEVAYNLREAQQVNIATTSEQLKDLPAQAISSLAVEASVTNYLWSQSEAENGDTIHHLIPE